MTKSAIIFLLAAFILSACASSAQGVVSTGVAQTAAAGQTQVALTPSLTSAPTQTPQPSSTPLPEYYWDGIWKLQWPGGVIDNVGIDQYGYIIQSTSYQLGPTTYYFQGLLSESGQSAGGAVFGNEVAGTPVPVPFQFEMLSANHDQFVGSFVLGGITYPLCGARNNAAFPNPCQWP